MMNICEACGTRNWPPYLKNGDKDVCRVCGKGLNHGQCNPNLGHKELVESITEDGDRIRSTTYRCGPFNPDKN